jgi:hypothetical protein
VLIAFRSLLEHDPRRKNRQAQMLSPLLVAAAALVYQVRRMIQTSGNRRPTPPLGWRAG